MGAIDTEPGLIANEGVDWRNLQVSDRIVNITDGSFEADVLEADQPVLIDFWAEWCGPCKMIAPILEGAAEEYKDRLKIAKLNVDDNPQTAMRFGIRSIPTLLLFKQGSVAGQKVGALSKSQLEAFLEPHVGVSTN